MREIIDKALMVTSSLLDAIDFHVDMSPYSTWKEKSLTSLQKMLARDSKFEVTPFTERGKAFEDSVCSLSRVKEDTFYALCSRFCSCDAHKLEPFYYALQGATFQKVVKGTINVEGQKIFLYGREDAWKPEKIVDIKTTSSWKTGAFSSEKSYQKRSQHQIYCTLDAIQDFEYLVAEFIDLGTTEPNWSVVDVHVIPIHIDSLEKEKEKLNKRIVKALDFIAQDAKMWSDYCTVFTKSFNK